MAHVIKGLIKAGVTVPQMDKALDRFSEAFQAQMVAEPHPDGLGEYSRATMEFEGVTLDLVSPNTTDSPIAQALESNGPGINTLVFEVDNLDDTEEAMREKGLAFVNRHVIDGNKVGFMHPNDGNGTLIEFVEFGPGNSKRNFLG